MKSKLPPLFRSRLLRWFLLVLISIGLLGYLVLPYIAKSVLTSQLNAKLHRAVSISEIVIHPYALSAYVRGFALQERASSATALSFDELYVQVDALSLLQGNLALKEIRLSNPHFMLIRNPDRSYNYSDLIEELLGQPDGKNKPEQHSSPHFALNNIQLNGGQIAFDDRPTGKIHHISDIRLAIPFISSLPSYTQVYVQPALEARINGRHILLAGKTLPFADRIEAVLEIDSDDIDLPTYLDYLPQKLPLHLSAGLLDSKLIATFSQQRGQKPSLQLNGDLAIKGAAIADANDVPAFALAKLKIHIGSASLFGAPLTAEGNVELSKLEIKNYRPMPALQADGASLNVSSQFAFALDRGKPGLALDKLSAELNDLDLHLAAEKNPFFSLASASVKNARFDLARRTLEIGEFASRSGKLKLSRASDGSFALAQLAAPAAPNTSPAKAELPWYVTLKKLAVQDYGVRFEDKLPKPMVSINAMPISLTAENLSTVAGTPATLNFSANLGKNAAIGAEGALSLLPLQTRLKLDIKNIDLVALQAYFTEKLNAGVTRGLLSARGELDFGLPAAAPAQVNYRGNANLVDFRVIDKADTTELLKWKSLYFGDIQSSTTPAKFAIGEIALSDFSSRLIINADGKLNLQQLVRPAPEPTTPPTPAANTPPAYEVKIGKLTLHGGNVNFSDRYIKPNYSANLTDIGGAVTGLSTAPGSTADVDLRGKMNGAAALAISGKINPLGNDVFVDLKAGVKGIELAPFTPYSGKYAGYAIDKGQLSLDVRYHIKDRKLEAENNLFLDQFTFGEPVASPDATRLPVQLAIALLKNRKGEIDIHLPIGGSLDDPQFSLSGLIIQVVVNMLSKAVTAPFALIGSLFGGGEELSHLEFPPGQQYIDTAGKIKLANLAQALSDRPTLKLEIIGLINPAGDKEGLKRALLEQKMKTLKLGDLTDEDISTGSIEGITLTAAEYPALLKRVYRHEDFPKPRNMLGFAKDLPAIEMEKLILAHTAISNDDLRDLANQRALEIKNWLLEMGKIPPERIFLVAPKLAKQDEKGQENGSRVDFALR